MALIGEMQYLTIGNNTYSIPISGGSTVSVESLLASGIKIATITVDSTSYDIYSTLVPSNTGSSNTGISIADHSTSSIYGVQTGTTTASKVTLGDEISIPNVTSTGTSPTLSYTSRSVGSASGWDAGSGSYSASVSNHVLSFSHAHTAPSLTISNISCDDITDWDAGSTATLGTAISVPNVTSATNVTVPIKNTSATTVVTSKSHSITDNGHTHTI